MTTDLLTDGVDVGAADPVRSSDVVFQVHVVAQVHLAGDRRKDEPLLPTVWHRKLYLAVESARPQQRRVQRVGTICCHYHLHSGNVSSLELSAGRPKFYQLEMVTVHLQTQFGEDRCTQFRVIVVTDPQTHPSTNRQDRLQYTALQLACSVL